MKNKIQILIGIIILSSSFIILQNDYDYKYFNPGKLFELKREFNRSALDIGKYISNVAGSTNKMISVKKAAPEGSLVNYYLVNNKNVVLEELIFDVQWSSLFPIPGGVQCESSILEEIKRKYLNFKSNVLIPQNKYKALYTNICEKFPYDKIAFIWLQKSQRFKNYDCFNIVKNKKIPPTFNSCFLHFATQSSIFSDLHKGDFLYVGTRFYFLTSLLNKQPSLKLVMEKNYSNKDRAVLYEVLDDNFQLIDDFKITVGKYIPSFLTGFKEEAPKRFHLFKSNILNGLFKVSDEELNSIMTGLNPCFMIKNRDFAVSTPCEEQWKCRY